jgi:hypothetical protein
MATKKKKKKTYSPTPAPQPQPRSLSDELGAITPFLGQISGMQSEQYLKDQKELAAFQYDFFRQHYPELAGLEREEQSKSTLRARTDAIGFLQNYGLSAQQAYEAANPRFTQQLNKIRDITGQIGQKSAITQELESQALSQLGAGGATTPFTETLDRQALTELQLGGALTPEEERNVQQSAREAWAARGQAGGTPSAIAEVLNRQSYSTARLRERQGIAAGREALGLQRQQTAQAFASAQQGFGLQQESLDRQFVLGAAGLLDQTSEANRLLSVGANATQPQTLLGFTQSVQTPNPAQTYGTVLGYGQDVFNTNLNMAASMYNSYQNNLAAYEGAKLQAGAQVKSAQLQAGAMGGGGGSGIAGAALGAVGSAASAAISAAICWVAREVFGEGDRRWRIFRVWLVLEAPKSLLAFYREHGQAIAAWLRKHPAFKPGVRAIMEGVL